MATRIVRGGGLEGLARTGAVVAAAFIASLVLLVIAYIPVIATHRDDVGGARWPSMTDGSSAGRSVFRSATVEGSLAGRPFTRMLFAGSDAAPAPPGVPRLPRAGEVYVSPSLAAEIDEHPESAATIGGSIVGRIGPEGLTRVDELIAYEGRSAEEMQDASLANHFGGAFHDTTNSGPSPMFVLGLLVLGPAAYLVAVCTRLSMRTRARRWDALRSVGVDRPTIRRIGGLETAVVSLPGLAAALGAFAVGAKRAAQIPVGGLQWFPDDVRVTPRTAMFSIVMGALLAYWMGARASRVTERDGPLDDQPDRWTRARTSVLHWVPLAFGLAVLASFLGVAIRKHYVDQPALFLLGVASTVVGVGLALAPLVRGLSAVAGRVAQSLAWRMGAKRAQFEPSSIVRVLMGVSILVILGYIASGVLVAYEDAVGADQREFVVDLDVGDLSPTKVTRLEAVPSESHLVRSNSEVDLNGLYASVIFTSCRDLRILVRANGRPCASGHTYRVHERGFDPDLSGGERFAFTTQASARLEVEVPEQSMVVDPAQRPQVLTSTDILITEDPPADPPRPASLSFVVSADGLESFERAVARVDPTLDASGTVDVPKLQGYYDQVAVVRLGVIAGGLLCVLCFLVASIDRLLERRGNVATLIAVGMRKRDVRGSQVVQLVLPLAGALGLANVAGWLICQAYLSVGGLNSGHLLAGLWMGTVLSGIAFVVAIVAALAVSVPKNVVEHLRTE